MALVVSGQMRHRSLQPGDVRACLQKRLPGLTVVSPDFSVDRAHCKVEFFCNTTNTLDFTVTVTAGSLPAPGAVAVLVRESDSVTAVLQAALSKKFRWAEISFCVLEDERSRSGLLRWERESPLRSRPAKFSYVLFGVLALLGAILVWWQLKQPKSEARDFNVVALILAIGLPAVTVPLPFVFEHLKLKGGGRWVFTQHGGGSS
jgi:hypothetical protein